MADACANGTDACAACGKAGCSLKVCNACKTTKYCSRDCQLSHWRGGHKDACKRMSAEQAMDAKLSQLPPPTDEELFAPPPPRDKCPICFLTLPLYLNGTQYMPCCSTDLCDGCVVSYMKTNEKGSRPCPFCRDPPSDGEGSFVKRIQKRIQANDVTAVYMLGTEYALGDLVPRNMDKAMTLFFRAAEMGCAKAHSQLAFAFAEGEGLEQDLGKAIRHWQIAAMAGVVEARRNLAVAAGKAGDADGAILHSVIAARAGDDFSLERVRCAFNNVLVTKDDYASVLRGHKESTDEMKSSARDEACVFRTNIVKSGEYEKSIKRQGVSK